MRELIWGLKYGSFQSSPAAIID